MMNVRFPSSVGFLSSLLTATSTAFTAPTFPSYYHRVRSTGISAPYDSSTSFSIFNWIGRGGGTIRGTTSRLFGSAENNNNDDDDNDKSTKVRRIGIVGGGLAGVTVAHALATRYNNSLDNNIHITVFEGDPTCRPNTQRYPWDDNNNNHEAWSAATARNANSLVPGAAMYVFARPSVMMQVLRDTVNEWWFSHSVKWGWNDIALFQRPPPYFALHLWHCIGPSASASERASFFHFMGHFLYSAVVENIFHADASANRRGRLLHQLASANRHAYLEATAQNNNAKNVKNWGHSQGFVSLYRTREAAEKSANEALAYGETGVQLLEPSQVTKFVPRVASLQRPEIHVESTEELLELAKSSTNTTATIIDYHGVRRANDHTASCELFIKHWVEEMVATGLVDYRPNARVARVALQEQRSSNKSSDNCNTPVYRVTTEDGTMHDFDLLVLAAGPTTPLLADQLGVLKYCPTYPLRGYSLTVFVDNQDSNESKNNKNSNLLLPQPFSLDSLYCSSVTPGMARLAGFGEFVGYAPKHKPKSELVPPSVGPAVLARYAQKLFPDVIDNATELEEAVLPCFRCLSPDDLPIAGEVPGKPGLFLHSGHGTLGWRCGLATGDCLAQAIVDRLQQTTNVNANTQEGTFTLQDGSSMERWILSPGRFASSKQTVIQTKNTVENAPSTRQPTSNEHSKKEMAPKHQ